MGVLAAASAHSQERQILHLKSNLWFTFLFLPLSWSRSWRYKVKGVFSMGMVDRE